jgi:hypothetical protein
MSLIAHRVMRGNAALQSICKAKRTLTRAGHRTGFMSTRPGKLIDLVWLWFRSPHFGLAARMLRTSERAFGAAHAKQVPWANRSRRSCQRATFAPRGVCWRRSAHLSIRTSIGHTAEASVRTRLCHCQLGLTHRHIRLSCRAIGPTPRRLERPPASNCPAAARMD